jgi:hypothetical protein
MRRVHGDRTFYWINSFFPMHFEYVNAGQVLIGIPALGMLAASILANVLHISPGAIGGAALRENVPLGAISNFILVIFLTCPFVVTVMHYSAALHAKSICDEVNKKLIDNNLDSSSSKQEQAPFSPSRRSRPEAPQRVPENQHREPIWSPESTKMACHRAKIPIASQAQLFLAGAAGFLIRSHVVNLPGHPIGVYSAIVSAMIVTCAASLRMMSVGLLRREREGASRYVRLIYQPRVMLMGLFQLSIAVYGILIAFSSPSVITGASFGGVPTSLQCRLLAVNVTYRDEFCSISTAASTQIYMEDWRMMAAFQTPAVFCNDGGFGPYRSTYDACIAFIAGEEVTRRRLYADLYAQTYLTLLLMISEHVTNTDPDLTISNFLGRNVGRWVKLAICSAYVGSLGIVMGVANMLIPGTQSMLSDLNTISSTTCSICFFASMIFLCINFATQRYIGRSKPKHYFVSYKQADGNDGVVMMLHCLLQPASVWLDKHADARDAAAMRAGVIAADVFIAVLSPRYFKSKFCCLELHTAIAHKKPIILTWNQSKKTVQKAMSWIPASLKDIGILNDELLPVQEDVQMARPCVDRISSAIREPMAMEAPAIIGVYTAPSEELHLEPAPSAGRGRGRGTTTAGDGQPVGQTGGGFPQHMRAQARGSSAAESRATPHA